MTTPREALAHLEKELARLEIYVESFLSVPSNRDERQVLATLASELTQLRITAATYLKTGPQS